MMYLSSTSAPNTLKSTVSGRKKQAIKKGIAAILIKVSLLGRFMP